MRICTLLIFLSSFFPNPAWATQTPAQAMQALQQAIDSNDQTLLERYLDLPAIIAQGVDLFVVDCAANPLGSPDDPLLEMLSGGLAQHVDSTAYQSIKLLLIQETSKFVLWGVASGTFSGQPATDPVPGGGLLSTLFANASMARKEIRSVRCAAPQGITATARAQLYDYGSERTYPLRLALTKQPEGHWKITAVTNLAELIRTVRLEVEQR